jgi:hypothetical protein
MIPVQGEIFNMKENANHGGPENNRISATPRLFLLRKGSTESVPKRLPHYPAVFVLTVIASPPLAGEDTMLKSQ